MSKIQYYIYRLSKSYKKQKMVTIGYKKLMYLSKFKTHYYKTYTFHAHYDLDRVPKVNDCVLIKHVKPISKLKHHIVYAYN